MIINLKLGMIQNGEDIKDGEDIKGGNKNK
jgi:hypothetical protein